MVRSHKYSHNTLPSPGGEFPGSPKYTDSTSETARAGVQFCARAHLWPNIIRANKRRIFALGSEALEVLTSKRGITNWRGSVLQLSGTGASKLPNVIPTLSPNALMKSPKFASAVIADFTRGLTIDPENFNLFPNLADVRRFKSKSFAFDFEWGHDGQVTLCGLSDRFFGAMVVPMQEPYKSALKEIFESATHLIGHNIIGADLRFVDQWGWNLRSDLQIEDTMLKQHLVQPDYPHSLAFVATLFTNKVFWKGHGWDEMDEESEGQDSGGGQQWRTWDKSYAIPRKFGGYGGCTSYQEAFALYNARDTSAEFQINTPLQQLLDRHNLDDLYRHVSVPVAYICRDMSEHGLRIDTSHLGDIRAEIDIQVSALETALPVGLAPYMSEVSCNIDAPDGTYSTKKKVCRGLKLSPHPDEVIVFTSPDTSLACPICSKMFSAGKMKLARIIKGTRLERIVPYNSATLVQAYADSLGLKTIYDHKTKRATTGKKARSNWAKEHSEFITLGSLKQQITLRNNFAKDTLLNEKRMYFNLKVHGTSEGRLSSSGRRHGIDLNIQNQPKQFRSIYVPDEPGWGFLSLDICQGENFLTTWIAQDMERWERIQDPTYDEHSDLATRIFNKDCSKAAIKLDPSLDALRQIGKKINHGRNYGMGIKKQQEVLIELGFDYFTQPDIKEFIEIWRAMNKQTAIWQTKTIEIAQRQGYLRNAFGRIRWFSSRAIATEALAFLPASTLADTVLRMMICHYPTRFLTDISANQTSVYHDLLPGWSMALQVHDELCFQGPWDGSQLEQLERTTQIMTQPWPQLDGFKFRVDAKGGMKSWGECKGL